MSVFHKMRIKGNSYLTCLFEFITRQSGFIFGMYLTWGIKSDNFSFLWSLGKSNRKSCSWQYIFSKEGLRVWIVKTRDRRMGLRKSNGTLFAWWNIFMGQDQRGYFNKRRSQYQSQKNRVWLSNCKIASEYMDLLHKCIIITDFEMPYKKVAKVNKYFHIFLWRKHVYVCMCIWKVSGYMYTELTHFANLRQ